MRVTGTIYGDVPLSDLVNADDLKAIEALNGTSGILKKTAANTWTLDTNAYTTTSGTVTSVRVQATSPVVSSVNTAQSATLNTTISLADNYGDTKNPYASKTARYVLAAPANAAGVPSFRALTNADVGLGNVENTKLSTWAGSSNITTIGTLSSGTVPWANISGKPSQATAWPNWSQIQQSGAENLSEGASDVTDNTEILTSYASNNGFADTNGKGIVYRRDAVHLYNYIKGKTDSIYATKTEMNGLIAAADAMVFKGTIGTGGTVTALPTTHNIGWTYKVITAGTYAGVTCEIGDLIICIADGTAANNAHWTVAQTNLDGAVIGPASATSGNIVLFDGTTGKLIKNSSYSPSSFAAAGHTHSHIVTVADNRNVATTPNDYSNKIIFQGLKTNTKIDTPSSDTYSYLVGLRGWSDSSGGNSHEFAFNNTGIYWRNGATTAWGDWARIYTTANKPTAADVGAATSGHTHATSIATSSGTNQITLALGTKYAITAGGTSYVFTMPSNPNTDTKQNIILGTTTKAFITGVSTTPTSTAQALTGIADTGVYLTTTAGQINAASYKIAEAGLISYNTTTGCIEITS